VTKPYGIEDLLGAIAQARAWRNEIEHNELNGEIHVELNSEVTLLQDLNDFLMNVCRSTPFTNEQVMQLRQAVMEMAQNAIEWGNKHQSDRLVNITYRIYDDRVVIIIRDQGTGFDRGNLPHAAAPDDPFSHLDVRDKLGLRAGGFGLMICKEMVDELQYNDKGNEVTLTKRFPPKEEPN
jgi:anti-sigma regulatory factor (Ser/Thr protein kinase)